MPKFTPIITNFTAGELSPRLYGRTDVSKYFNGAKTLENMVCTPYGGTLRRPGSKFVAEVRDSSKSTRLIPFEFSDDQTYIMEFSDSKIRFYTSHGQITETAKNITGATKADPCVITSAGHGFSDGDEVIISGVVGMTELNGRTFEVDDSGATFSLNDKDGNDVDSTGYTTYVSGGTVSRIYEIASPYDEDEIWDIQFVQSEDIMYLIHYGFAPRKLSRTSDTSWTLATVSFLRGPFLDDNITATTMTPSADAGAGVTLTASTDTFTTDHVGSYWRIKSGVVKVTAYTSATVVTVTVQAEPDGTAGDLATGPGATTDWAEGAWSEERGWPSCVAFYEQRLALASTTYKPQTVWLSVSGSFENFEAGSDDDDAITYTIAAQKVNAIRWMSPGRVLALGTVSGIYSLSSGSSNEALTPTNVKASLDTTYGANYIVPVKIGNFTYYMQRNNRTMREFSYSFDIDEHVALDMTILSDHITESGIVDVDYQQSPYNILWCVRDDGELVAMTREIDQQVIGWTRCISGDDSVQAGKYEAVAVISNGEEDEVWAVVNRTIDGTTRRFVEYLMPFNIDDQEDAYFVDCGLSIDNPITISGATNADPIVITAASHGLSDGDLVTIRNVVGMTEINNRKFKVANKATHTFELTDSDDNDIDGTEYGTYISGGEARKCYSTFSGLRHLAGETVSVLTDGAAHPDCEVSATGTITLNNSYGEVHAGLPYTSTVQTLRIEGGSATGTSQNKIKRVYKVAVRLNNSLGMKVGNDDGLDTVYFRSSAMPTDRAPELFTGDKEIQFPAGYDKDAYIKITQEQPLPLEVIAIMPKTEVYDS